MFKPKRVYLDYAAATPLSKAARLAMRAIEKDVYGNPSAIHKEGQVARQVVENARKQVAKTVQVRPEYVTFTSGGTEANNIAIVGLIERLHADGRAYSDMQIVTTKLEHPSVTNACLALEKCGVQILFVDVDEIGQINRAHLSELLTSQTVLVSLAYANSEIGVVQSLHQLTKTIKAAEARHATKIFTHLDAAQAPLWLNCQFDTLGFDLVALDFAKCGGPKGIGALLRSRRVEVAPVLYGGGQESGVRSGTENVFGIVGGAAAFAAAQSDYKKRTAKVAVIRDVGIELLKATDDRVVLNGPVDENRIANNINISIPGVDTEYLAVWLDSKGFAVSTKSACAGAGGGESAVVRAISDNPARANSTLRITLGPDTTIQNLKALANEIKTHLSLMLYLTQK